MVSPPPPPPNLRNVLTNLRPSRFHLFPFNVPLSAIEPENKFTPYNIFGKQPLRSATNRVAILASGREENINSSVLELHRAGFNIFVKAVLPPLHSSWVDRILALFEIKDTTLNRRKIATFLLHSVLWKHSRSLVSQRWMYVFEHPVVLRNTSAKPYVTTPIVLSRLEQKTQNTTVPLIFLATCTPFVPKPKSDTLWRFYNSYDCVSACTRAYAVRPPFAPLLWATALSQNVKQTKKRVGSTYALRSDIEEAFHVGQNLKRFFIKTTRFSWPVCVNTCTRPRCFNGLFL